MTAVELIAEIRKQAASMSDEERREVAEELIAVGEDLVGGDRVAPGEAEMVERRVRAIRDGSATLVSGDAFFANVRAKLSRR